MSDPRKAPEPTFDALYRDLDGRRRAALADLDQRVEVLP